MLPGLFDPETWKTQRREAMEAARGCRAVLTDPEGSWRYAPDDERVRKGVGVWVAKARRAHAIALGRKPVLPQFAYVDETGYRVGPVHVRAS